jgi:outer membrane protein OmpA-like peptidoglycan-associated protein
VVRAEDARVIAIRAERVEADNNERQAGLARENAAAAQADAAQADALDQARRRAQADADRSAAEQAKAEALAAAQQANAAAQQANTAAQQAIQERQAAEQAKLEADQARLAAIAEQQRLAAETDQAKQAAANADAMRLKAEQEQAQVRQQLLAQLNTILETRDTARGLIVNMSDVLFDTAKYSLKPGAREKLAKVSGIILSHPGLKIDVEGHTDSVGGDEYNMRLSENRANSVRDYLVAQGVSADAVTAQGFGKTQPVADNSTAAGRQRNRRVEMVVSGEILGTSVTDARTSPDIRDKQ